MTHRKSGITLLLVCLLFIIMPPLQAASTDASLSAPLIAVSFPNLLQEKPKTQWDWKDFQKDGENALENGNYEDAIASFNQAEAMLLTSDPGSYRESETDFALSYMEKLKGDSYAKWDGHQAEAQKAYQKSSELEAKAKAKIHNVDNGCLIVTATFGSPMASEVQLVRSFRDDSIVKSYTGSRFMPGFNAWYYSFSPQVSTYINEHPVTKPAMQVLITPILQIVLIAQIFYSAVSFNPELATIVSIIVGSTLFGLIYLFPTAMVGVWIARLRGWDGGNIRVIWPAAIVWGALLLLIVAGSAFSLDLLTTVASGLFVIATIILTTGALSLLLSRYIGRKGAAAQE
ncbi:MAG: CFI-box-CTERM domain-containing protein [Methanoregula sp.]